jgi:lipopolysaccharide/colanic/teichoic acid biosynthesis glycosyltransferase
LYTESDGHVLDRTARTLEARQIADNIWVGRNHVIHPSVRLAPPVYIGDNCQIGADVDVGPDVVLGHNVVIDAGATVSQSVVLDYTYVGKLMEIINRIVNKNLMIDVETAEYTEVANSHLLGEAHPNLIDSWLRRTWDTAVSIFLLLLTLPVTLPIGLITWLTTGQMIEPQTHLGRHLSIMTDDSGLNTFRLYRFNTHRSNGDDTRFGRWLEKSDIYRLPELWNVLKGDMSLIGVKPLRPEEAADITEAWQQQRYQHPAGFTGLWYIQTDSASDLDEILIADAYYVATRTKRGDVSLFWRTLACWFGRLWN